MLVTTSFVYAFGLEGAKAGRNRRVLLVLPRDRRDGGRCSSGSRCSSGARMSARASGPARTSTRDGPDVGGQHLFWLLYYAGTSLHLVHMVIGIGLVSWIAWRAHRLRFSPGYHTPVEAVGLYWSFVDLVWINLYPFIYLVDRR